MIIINTLSQQADIQTFISKLKQKCHPDSKIAVVFKEFLWKSNSNWLSRMDIENMFYLEGFVKIKHGENFLVFRPERPSKSYSVSVIIPVRNEQDNIKGILRKIPKFGTSQEIIFVEGHSIDATYQAVQKEIKNYPYARLYKQLGIGKADAVRFGFKKAQNEILMILDGDLTVDPAELPKFYNALASGKGDFIMGSRLVYPVENNAMRTLNILGNKLFSFLFSYLLNQPIKDTLCGTKVLFTKDCQQIRKNNYFGDSDPFGDFDLIFGASKLNLKILEIPVRYKQRSYGHTNIRRFAHGLMLLKMVYLAIIKLKWENGYQKGFTTS